MDVVTKRSKIRTVADRWYNARINKSSQYQFLHQSTLERDQKTHEKLLALDLETADEDEVIEIIGNNTWTFLICDCCGEDVDALVDFQLVNESVAPNVSICKFCLTKALKEIEDECN